MKHGWLKYFLLGGVFYIVFLIVTAPAAWLALGVAHLSNGRVNLNQATGSVWGGSAELVVGSGSAAPRGLGRLEWRINPLWLVAARVSSHVRLTAAGVDVHGAVAVAPGMLRLGDIHGSANAGFVTVLYPAASLFAPGGQFQVQAERVQFETSGVTGGVTSGVTGGLQLTWQDAAVSLSPVRPLGDYMINFEGAGEVVRVKVATVKGDLVVASEGQVGMRNSQYQIAGTVSANARAGELAPLLNMLGADVGDGRRKFSLNGRLPF